MSVKGNKIHKQQNPMVRKLPYRTLLDSLGAWYSSARTWIPIHGCYLSCFIIILTKMMSCCSGEIDEDHADYSSMRSRRQSFPCYQTYRLKQPSVPGLVWYTRLPIKENRTSNERNRENEEFNTYSPHFLAVVLSLSRHIPWKTTSQWCSHRRQLATWDSVLLWVRMVGFHINMNTKGTGWAVRRVRNMNMPCNVSNHLSKYIYIYILIRFLLVFPLCSIKK